MKNSSGFLLLMLLMLKGYGQSNIVIGSVIRTSAAPCETDTALKTILLEIKAKENYRALKKFTINNCLNFYPFPKYSGKFRITVTASNCEPAVLEFDILASTKDTLMLKELVLQQVKVTSMEKVTVTAVKKEFIKVEADKTTFLVKSNEMLSEGTAYDAVLKLPGVLADPNGNLVISGNTTAVWIDGQPSSLTGQDMVNFLNNLPANVIEKIEVISNPGTSYDANTSGGIINIITTAKTMKGLSGTLNAYYGRSRYDKPGASLTLNGRVKKTGWQVSAGYSENNADEDKRLSNLFSDITPAVPVSQQYSTRRKTQPFFARTSLDYAVNKNATIGFKYNMNTNRDNAVTEGSMQHSSTLNDFLFTSLSKPYEKTSQRDLFVYYRQKTGAAGGEFNLSFSSAVFDKDRVNSVFQSTTIMPSPKTYTGSVASNSLLVKTQNVKADLSMPSGNGKTVINAGMKFSFADVHSNGLYNLNNADVSILANPVYTDELRFKYGQANYGFYLEARKKMGKLSLSAGLRYEYFRLTSDIANKDAAYSKSFSNLFPAVSVLYEMNKAMNLTFSYAKKIEQPGYTELDPNLNGYFDNFTSARGNPVLEPNYFNNFETKLTLLKYISFGFTYSNAKTQNLTVLENTGNFKTSQSYKTFEGLRNTGYSLGLPVPFAVFTQGLKFFKNNINIDRTNFLYIVAGYNSYRISGAEEYISSFKPSFYYNLYSQLVLPWELKLGLNYSRVSKGTYQVYQINKPIQKFDLTLSRSFLNKALKVTVSARDIFNTVELSALTFGKNINTSYSLLRDTRSLRVGISYNFGKFSALHKQKEKPDDDEEIKRIERKGEIGPKGNN
jgi:iron complex outermembrane recepter protein